jgi:hypothetical protein
MRGVGVGRSGLGVGVVGRGVKTALMSCGDHGGGDKKSRKSRRRQRENKSIEDHQ